MENEIIARLDNIERLARINAKQMLNVDDLCLLTGWKRRYVYQLTSNNLIPYYKPQGKTVYFDKKEINEWMHQNRVNAMAEVEHLQAVADLMNVRL